jgi:hypothetical protein
MTPGTGMINQTVPIQFLKAELHAYREPGPMPSSQLAARGRLR